MEHSVPLRDPLHKIIRSYRWMEKKEEYIQTAILCGCHSKLLLLGFGWKCRACAGDSLSCNDAWWQQPAPCSPHLTPIPLHWTCTGLWPPISASQSRTAGVVVPKIVQLPLTASRLLPRPNKKLKVPGRAWCSEMHKRAVKHHIGSVSRISEIVWVYIRFSLDVGQFQSLTPTSG